MQNQIKRKSTSRSTAADPPSTRWWEFYLVRYFIGFIFGTICVTVIALKLRIIRLDEITDKTSNTILVAFCLLGIGYCYIASTPITVLHNGRYGRGAVDGCSRYIWLSISALCGLMVITQGTFYDLQEISILERIGILISSILIMVSLLINSQIQLPDYVKKFLQWTNNPYWSLTIFPFSWALVLYYVLAYYFRMQGINSFPARMCWLLSIPVLWIGMTQYFVLYRIIHQKEKYFEFYVSLFKARRNEKAKDVRDTYTHLREHSNSIFILTVEIGILAVLLALIDLNSDASTSIINYESYAISVLGLLIIWMVPTIFMWSRANSMEKDFSVNSDKYL